MTVVVKINLDRYNATEIIEMLELGIITVDEVDRSGRVETLFAPEELEGYLARRRREERMATPRELLQLERMKGYLS